MKFLKSERRSLSVETIYNYLEWLEKAFVIYRCPRYDMQGKEVLKTQEKFYLSDPSLKYCILGYNPKSVAAMLENIVYFELKRRGYEVYIGKNGTKEIDFVAVLRDEKVYIQVCRNMTEESDREVQYPFFYANFIEGGIQSNVDLVFYRCSRRWNSSRHCDVLYANSITQRRKIGKCYSFSDVHLDIRINGGESFHIGLVFYSHCI